MAHGTRPDRPRAVRRWLRKLGDQHAGSRRWQRADRRGGCRDPARPGDRAGGDHDQRAGQPGAHDPAVAMDRLARGALVPARGDRRVRCWAAGLFAHIGTQWLQIVLALFLISTAWQYRMGVRPRSFSMRLPWFVPVSFVSGLTSAVVGASGLLVNPFYLNYGLMKEAMLATRAVNSLAIQLVKIGAYVIFGVLHWRLARHGLVAGAGAITAIWLANPWLRASVVISLSSARRARHAVRRAADPVAAARVPGRR